MPQSEIVELDRMATRLSEETAKLKQYLKDLTTDGSGYLYDLKMAVGSDSELGFAISRLGGSVMQASEKAVNSFEELYKIMQEHISTTNVVQEEADSSYGTLSQQFDEINFD